MMIAVTVLSILVVFLFFYLLLLRNQLRSMSRQLKQRFDSRSRQRLSVELFDKELNQLTEQINNCLKAEETLRLDFVREERSFREMIANISHDLRTPLTAIKGYHQLLEKDIGTGEQEKRLRIAQKYAEELGNLIEHFFEYSYLLNREGSQNMESVNLTMLVIESLMEFVEPLEERNLNVSFEEEEHFFVQGDKELLTRIIQNLVRNCLLHSAGDIKVQITKNDFVTLVFENPVNKREEIDVTKLFERFYTGDKARKNRTGLGLSIVKLLAEQMGGSVGAELVEDNLRIFVSFLPADKIK